MGLPILDVSALPGRTAWAWRSVPQIGMHGRGAIGVGGGGGGGGGCGGGGGGGGSSGRFADTLHTTVPTQPFRRCSRRPGHTLRVQSPSRAVALPPSSLQRELNHLEMRFPFTLLPLKGPRHGRHGPSLPQDGRPRQWRGGGRGEAGCGRRGRARGAQGGRARGRGVQVCAALA